MASWFTDLLQSLAPRVISNINLSPLDVAVQREERYVETTSGLRHAANLNNLGLALMDRYSRLGRPDDLTRAVTTLTQSVRETPETHTSAPLRLYNLVYSLTQRAELQSDLGDADLAVEYGDRAVAAAQAFDPEKLPPAMTNLAGALLCRFLLKSTREDADRSIDLYERALSSTPPTDPRRPQRLSNLAIALSTRSSEFAAFRDFDRALSTINEAILQTAHSGRDNPGLLSQKGLILQKKFQWSSSQVDIDAAIAASVKASEALVPQDSDWAYNECTLGVSLTLRAERTRSRADVDTALYALRRSVQATPDNSIERGRRMDSLGSVLRLRYVLAGSLGDLREAIDMRLACLDCNTRNHLLRSRYLMNLANCYFLRFERTHSTEDLNRAISATAESVQNAPTDNPNHAASLNAQATLLIERFNHDQDKYRNDLDLAISVLNVARSTVLYDNDKALISNSMAVALIRRNDEDDISLAARILAEIMDLPPSLYSPMFCLNYAATLEKSDGRDSSGEGLTLAIDKGFEALGVIESMNPKRAQAHLTIGNCLVTKGKKSDSKSDLMRAEDVYISGFQSPCAPPSDRILCAYRAARALSLEDDIKRAYPLLKSAVELMSATTPRTIHRDDQLNSLTKYSGLPALAAGACLEVNRKPFEALQLLELGRGILAGLQMETRTDITDLEEAYPELGRRFRGLQKELDSSSLFPLDFPAFDERLLPEWAKAERRHVASEEFNHITGHIRSLKGFENFMLGLDEKTILSLAEEGPIVVFNVTVRSDAFLITREIIRYISLPRVKLDDIEANVTKLRHALRTCTLLSYAATNNSLREILKWLWEVAVEPVLDELGYREAHTANNDWPKIWWVPSGPFSLLPIHAAGVHCRGSTQTAMDRVISSYAPSLKALFYARQKRANMNMFVEGRALLVGMPQTHNRPDLPHVNTELDMVGKSLQSSVKSSVLCQPTRSAVLDQLGRYQYVHLACHGESILANPSFSRFLLKDWETAPLDVNEIARLDLSQSQLAYLSACYSADNPKMELLDEAIHLAAACQLAGFPSVVGTLWRAIDADSGMLAAKFYRAVFEGTSPVPWRASASLHFAIRELREEKRFRSQSGLDDPMVWAPYIYTGA